MSGLETALVGAAANVVSKEVVQWIKNRGPEYTEVDWQQAGLPVARQIRAKYEQLSTSHRKPSDEGRFQDQLQIAGEIYRELSYIGDDRGFDDDIIDIYSEMAALFEDWRLSPELELGAEPEEHPERFEELLNEYKRLVE